jgi:hydrogenase maturation protease
VSRRVLVAGVGNIFLGDDGFGVEVANRLAREELPRGVRVEDVGIRGVHLAYELLDGWDELILVDAIPRGGEPGTVYVIEPELGDDHSGPVAAGDTPLLDAHGMEPGSVLSVLPLLGGRVERVVIVGCEPAEVTERIGLSEPASRAVHEAVRVVKELIEAGGTSAEPSRRTVGRRRKEGDG